MNSKAQISIMESVSSNTSQAPRRPLPLSNPIIHSASLHRFACKLTFAEARQIFSADQVQKHEPAPTSPFPLLKFLQCEICPNLALRLGLDKMLIRAALRWPKLETHLPSVRRLAALRALTDQAQIESGGELSTSAPAALVRRLKAYRDEMPRLTVIHSAAVL